MHDKPVALVTGANKGIGLQIAKDLAAFIQNELGRLDVLVNNAGVSQAGKPGSSLEEIAKSGRASVASLDEVRVVFETNVFGVIAVTQAMLPLLREAPADAPGRPTRHLYARARLQSAELALCKKNGAYF